MTELGSGAGRSPLFVWLRALLVIFAVVALPADLVNPAVQSAVASESVDGDAQEYLDEKAFADGLSGAIVVVTVTADYGAALTLQPCRAGCETRQKGREPFSARGPPELRI